MLRLLLWALILMAVLLAVFIRTRNGPEPEPSPQILVPLGSNFVTKGATYYNPENRKAIGTILDTTEAYEFDDGTVRPGVLVRGANGAESWVPRENMDRVLVAPERP